MKLIIAALMFLSTFPASAQDTVFEASNPQQPIVLKIQTKNYDTNVINLFESDSKMRLQVYTPDNTYRYIASSGYSSQWLQMSGQAMQSLQIFAAAASVRCPLEISLDRGTLKIIKVKAACDPLAALSVEDNAG